MAQSVDLKDLEFLLGTVGDITTEVNKLRQAIAWFSGYFDQMGKEVPEWIRDLYGPGRES